jgi:hypothetical protein
VAEDVEQGRKTEQPSQATTGRSGEIFNKYTRMLSTNTRRRLSLKFGLERIVDAARDALKDNSEFAYLNSKTWKSNKTTLKKLARYLDTFSPSSKEYLQALVVFHGQQHEVCRKNSQRTNANYHLFLLGAAVRDAGLLSVKEVEETIALTKDSAIRGGKETANREENIKRQIDREKYRKIAADIWLDKPGLSATAVSSHIFTNCNFGISVRTIRKHIGYLAPKR